MAPSRTTYFLLGLLSVLPSSLASLECNNILAKGQHFNFEKLSGPRVVHWTHKDTEDDIEFRYNFTLDICSKLRRDKGVPKDEWCHDGARVCGTRLMHDLNGLQNDTIQPIDIAGTYTLQGGLNMVLDPQYELLRDSKSNSDAAREGVRVELHGGRLPFNDKKTGVDQRAIIEFVCDAEREGDEGADLDDGEHETDGDDSSNNEERSLVQREGEGKGKCEDSDASLRFCGYELEDVNKDKKAKTLRLEWRTKYACENAPPPDTSSHWGFFTWFIIILFLATAAYLIFGSWLNYNRYGARGWDLLPHGDTIRDIPYMLKDLGRKVVDTVQDRGSRGGYSAV